MRCSHARWPVRPLSMVAAHGAVMFQSVTMQSFALRMLDGPVIVTDMLAGGGSISRSCSMHPCLPISPTSSPFLTHPPTSQRPSSVCLPSHRRSRCSHGPGAACA